MSIMSINMPTERQTLSSIGKRLWSEIKWVGERPPISSAIDTEEQGRECMLEHDSRVAPVLPGAGGITFVEWMDAEC